VSYVIGLHIIYVVVHIFMMFEQSDRTSTLISALNERRVQLAAGWASRA